MAGAGEALICAATPPRLVSRVLAPTLTLVRWDARFR
jgi:hypothetical protein